MAKARAAMPNPGTSKAPPTWKGDEDDLSEFLDHFEALADDAGVKYGSHRSSEKEYGVY
jgi:hypothetical protein